jgi:FixJ family two-component response regulator
MICVVDDDISVLRSLQELLASDGLEAQTFDDPEKFLDYTRTHNVKLAVLDYAMPR